MPPLPPSLEGSAPLLPETLQQADEAKSILRPQKDERYGFGYSISPYRGCSHGCRYCFVREYPNAVHGPETWGQWSSPKTNAAELLWAQRHKLHNQAVFLSTATDPYQPLEKEFRLTRACLEVLLDCPTCRVHVHTRSGLVLRDLDVLKLFGSRLRVGISIPTDDDTVRQKIEPKAPPIPLRWATVERLAREGVAVTVAATPLMPMTDPAGFGRRVTESGASGLWVGSLRLLKNDPFYDLLAVNHWLRILDPDHVEAIRDILQSGQPMPRRTRASRSQPRRALPCLPERRPQPMHPGLFDGVL